MSQTTIPPYVILGCGYVGTRLAQSLLDDGAQVRVCARRVALLDHLRARGAQVHYMDANRPHQFGPAMLGLDQPVVVYAIPGVPDLPQGEAIRRAASAALKVHARAFIYLGSSAVYGRSEGNSNSDWVDEETAVATSDPEAGMRLTEEASLQSIAPGGLRTVILRLSAIYGPQLSPHLPARGVRQRLRSGQYKMYDGGRYFFSRVYVDDLVRIIRAAADRAIFRGPTLATYVVGDDHPCPQGEYASWLCEHLKLPMPTDVDAHLGSGPRQTIRGRRLRNSRLKESLSFEFQYPSFREGELQLDTCEQSHSVPLLNVQPADPNAPVAAATPVAQPPLPSAQSGLDIGVALGGEPLGVTPISLAPGHTAQGGTVYFVLSGKLTATRSGQPVEVGPRSLVPAFATLHNSGDVPAELLAVSLRPRH